MDFTVTDNKEKNRFEASIEGKTAFMEYDRTENKMIITHTEVPKELGGKGVASGLVKQVLHRIEKEGLKIESKCGFVSGYLERHPEYNDLLV